MLRWYYRIRLIRREKSQAYVINDRLCKSRLGWGFSPYLQKAEFFDIRSNRYILPSQRRRRLMWLVLLPLCLILIWAAVESVLYLIQ